MEKLSFEDKMAECRGKKVYENSLLRFTKTDMLLLTFVYVVGNAGNNVESSFTIRFSIREPSELSMSDLQTYIGDLLKNHIAPLFCINVSFPYVNFRFAGEKNVRRIIYGNITGNLEELGSTETVQLEVGLSSGRKQVLKLKGISRHIMSWNLDNSIYTDVLLVFNRMLQNPIRWNEVHLRAKGFHFGTRHRNIDEFVVAVQPIGFVKTGRKVRPGKGSKENMVLLPK
jgi:hypothetical protein